LVVGATIMMWLPPKHSAVERVFQRVAAIDDKSRPKICAHRSNNIPMYRGALDHFDCIEIDIHINPTSGGPPASTTRRTTTIMG
jgi:hypothetical protein